MPAAVGPAHEPYLCNLLFGKSHIAVQIIIPMSGFGERFRRAGYTLPKPLIEIDDRPIIGHVIDLFPGEHDFIFICNQDHLDHPEYAMRAKLENLCPSGRILGIAPHKLGPVHAVRQATHLIDPTQPAVVNYCDFTCFWDWTHFKTFVADSGCAGAIPAYRGFHPHSLGSTNYAYMREQEGWVLDIQEKQPYTDQRMNEYASSGSYYFANGQLMLDAFAATMAQRLDVNGEYYVSLAYKPLLAAGQSIAVYPLQHFMQWGTPDDVAEYRGWSHAFRQLINPAASRPARGALVMPMAGLGQRFVNEGYELPKPLIPVSGKPMVEQAAHDLPKALHHSFVLRADMPGRAAIGALLAQRYPNAVLHDVPAVTEGQACSARIGLNALHEHLTGVDAEVGPVTFGACDSGALYDSAALHGLMDDPSVDVIVWGARGHANAVRNPQMFGWIDATQDGGIQRVSVKHALADPARDPIVTGTFTFRRAGDFLRATDRLLARDGRVNGEFYIDSCINDALALGLNCRLFEIDSLLSWGTPNDLRTFEYWQSCFHKWPSHPYRLELDRRVDPAKLADLETRYRAAQPDLPKSNSGAVTLS